MFTLRQKVNGKTKFIPSVRLELITSMNIHHFLITSTPRRAREITSEDLP